MRFALIIAALCVARLAYAGPDAVCAVLEAMAGIKR